MSKFRTYKCLLLMSALLMSFAAKAQTIPLDPVQNINKVEIINISGTDTVNDVVSLVVTDSSLPSGAETVPYTVQTGDTNLKIAQGLTAAIKADVNLVTLGVSAVARQSPKSGATAAKAFVSISSNSPTATTYSGTTSSGATETLALTVNPNTLENATISGTLTAGDTVAITVHDVALPGGLLTVSYVVQSADTLTSAASNFAAQLTASALKQYGISATAASGVLAIQSYSPNVTTYTSSVIGTTETLGLAVNPSVTQIFPVTGTPVKGNLVLFGFVDAGLPTGHEQVKYTVPANATAITVAKGVAKAINADTALAGGGVSATSAGGDIIIAPYYAFPVTVESQTATTPEVKKNKCVPISSATTWPAPFVFVCTTVNDTPAQITQLKKDAQTILATVTALGDTSASPGGANAPDAAAKLPSSGGKWLIYQNHDDFNNLMDWPVFSTGGLSFYCVLPIRDTITAPGNIGYTLPCNNASASVFFEDAGGGILLSGQKGGFPHIVAHETGHQVDKIYGNVFNSTLPYSETASFTAALNTYDMPIMNSIPVCAFQASDGNSDAPGGGYWAAADPSNPGYPDDSAGAGGVGGFFTGTPNPGDSSGTGFICSGAYGPDGVTVENNGGGRSSSFGNSVQAVLSSPGAYGTFFQNEVYGAISNIDPRHEIFAEEFAFYSGFYDFTLVGGQPSGGSDGIFYNLPGFVCTSNAMTSVTVTGAEQSSLEQNAYNVPMPSSHGYMSTGCDGSSNFIPYNFAD